MRKIICSAILLPTWEIITWLRHHNCLNTITLLKDWQKTSMEAQWFIDNKGKFVTRKEAREIILNNNQIIRSTREDIKKDTYLYSEDLY